MKKFVVVMMLSGFTWAAAFAADKPEGAFDTTLATLRESVAGLSKENQALNARNAETRARIRELNERIRTLEAESRRLGDRKEAEAARSARRNGNAEALKARLVQVDGSLKELHDEKASIERRIDPLEDEVRLLGQKADALGAEIAALNAPGADDPWKRDIASARATRDQLQEQLNTAALKLGAAKRSWEEMNALVSTGPQQVDVLRTQQEELEKAIPRAESDLAGINARIAELQAWLDRFSAEDYSDVRAGRLESEVRDMSERNRKLETEIFAAQKAADEKVKRFEEERVSAVRQYDMKKQQLSQRNVQLREELDALRKQMVALDKKKAALEQGIYTQP